MFVIRIKIEIKPQFDPYITHATEIRIPNKINEKYSEKHESIKFCICMLKKNKINTEIISDTSSYF